MPMKKIKITKKAVLGVVGAIVLGTIGSLIATLILKISIKNIFRSIAIAVYKVLTFAVPVWVLLIIASLSVIALIFLSRKRPKSSNWHWFRKMEYRGRLFSWEYPYQSDEPYNFKELCKKCGCELNETRCPNCDNVQTPLNRNSRDYYPFISDLTKVITMNIETGKYKQYIY